MTYSFDTDLAQQIGVNEAIILQNLVFWLKKNKANNSNFYDGNYWTYNSHKAFSELFPFWTENQIRRILESLLNQGVIIKGNYNESQYDKTKWYALSVNYAYLIGHICQVDMANLPDGNGVNAISIIDTDNKPDSKPDSKLQIVNTDIKPNGSNAHFAIDVINHLNFAARTNYKHGIKKTIDLITARRKEGFTLEDFKTVIDKKCAEWLRDPKYCKYLRPETLFGTKFESYLNSITSKPKQTLAERMIVSDKIKSALERQGINMSDVYSGAVKIEGLSWEVVPYMGGTRCVVAYDKPIDTIDAEVL